MKDLETYKRKSILAKLKNFCHLANDGAYIEITEWKNGEGVDLMLSSFQDRIVQLTFGELKAIKKLIKHLDK